jgi:hypothetical protein
MYKFYYKSQHFDKILTKLENLYQFEMSKTIRD